MPVRSKCPPTAAYRSESQGFWFYYQDFAVQLTRYSRLEAIVYAMGRPALSFNHSMTVVTCSIWEALNNDMSTVFEILAQHSQCVQVTAHAPVDCCIYREFIDRICLMHSSDLHSITNWRKPSQMFWETMRNMTWIDLVVLLGSKICLVSKHQTLPVAGEPQLQHKARQLWFLHCVTASHIAAVGWYIYKPRQLGHFHRFTTGRVIFLPTGIAPVLVAQGVASGLDTPPSQKGPGIWDHTSLTGGYTACVLES